MAWDGESSTCAMNMEHGEISCSDKFEVLDKCQGLTDGDITQNLDANIGHGLAWGDETKNVFRNDIQAQALYWVQRTEFEKFK